jgi:hypothetical protein
MGERELYGELVGATRAVRAMNVAGDEAAPAHAVVNRLVPRLRRSLEGMSALIQRVEASASAAAVADVSHMARRELAVQLQRLGALTGAEPTPRVLGECGASQTVLLRASAAVKEALRAHLGLRPQRGSRQLARSLALRAAYTHLRKELRAGAEPEPGAVAARLQEAGERVEAFVAGPDFALARIEDRLLLRSLQGRVRAFLVDPGDAREGLRLYQDLTSCAELLRQINLRSELVTHDRALVEAARRRLGRLANSAAVPEALLARLRRLYGRDDEVDQLLDPDLCRRVGPWTGPLGRLKASLDPRPAPTGEDWFAL